MAFDAEAALAAEVVDDRLQAAVGHLDRPAAAPTDDVVVMLARCAGDVGVLAGGQVEPLQGALVGQQVERPEDGRPPDPDPVGAGVSDQVGRSEVARATSNEVRKDTPWCGIAGGRSGSHTANDTQYQEERNTPGQYGHGGSFGAALAGWYGAATTSV